MPLVGKRPAGGPYGVLSTGDSGAIANVFGLEVASRHDAASLAVGFERGIPCSPSDGLAEYTKLATNLNEASSWLVVGAR